MENDDDRMIVFCKPIYIFSGYYDKREDEYGICFEDDDKYINKNGK